MPSVTVGLLTYKEKENLEILLPQIKEVMNNLEIDYDVVVVDAKHSQDGSKMICLKNEAKYYIQDGYGQANAMKNLIKICDKDLLLLLDADCSHNPKYIPHIYNMFVDGQYDIVIGSRYTIGGSTNDKKTSQIMSHILNGVMRIVMGIKAKDISGGYRLYDAKQIKAIELKAKNFEMQQEILIRMKANNKNIRIGEYPIHFEQRRFGKSTRHLLKYIWCYFLNIFKTIGIRIKYGV